MGGKRSKMKRQVSRLDKRVAYAMRQQSQSTEPVQQAQSIKPIANADASASSSSNGKSSSSETPPKQPVLEVKHQNKSSETATNSLKIVEDSAKQVSDQVNQIHADFTGSLNVNYGVMIRQLQHLNRIIFPNDTGSFQ